MGPKEPKETANGAEKMQVEMANNSQPVSFEKEADFAPTKCEQDAVKRNIQKINQQKFLKIKNH